MELKNSIKIDANHKYNCKSEEQLRTLTNVHDFCYKDSKGKYNDLPSCVFSDECLKRYFSTKNSDITNYAYIWYKKDPTKLLDFTKEELEKIYKIIIDYSYPCYLMKYIEQNERKELLENELLFIQKKLIKAKLFDIIIKQIPRVLYDLFNLYYYKKNKLDLIFEYNCEAELNRTQLADRQEHNSLTSRHLIIAKPHIFELNKFIINHISSNIDNITTAYLTILDSIFSELDEIDNLLLTRKSKEIIRQIFNFENQISKGNTILYRGANYKKDSTRLSIDNLVSISLNMSIFSGFCNDPSACTLNFMNKLYNDKIKYTIKKFFLHDWSDEDSLFFIPPIHPFLQLYCKGELWHPRTKKGINGYHGKINGLACPIKYRDYLSSFKTIEELEELFQQYKSSGQISVWQKKYLKYKNKYFELKKYLSII